MSIRSMRKILTVPALTISGMSVASDAGELPYGFTGHPIMLLSREKMISQKKLLSQRDSISGIFREHISIKPLRTFYSFQRVSHPVGTLHLIVTFIRHVPSGDHPSSLIQVVGFSERPCIVPHEIQSGLNAGARALSLISVQTTVLQTLDSQDQSSPVSSSRSRRSPEAWLPASHASWALSLSPAPSDSACQYNI